MSHGYSFQTKVPGRRLIESHPSVGNLIGVNEQYELGTIGTPENEWCAPQIEVDHRESVPGIESCVRFA